MPDMPYPLWRPSTKALCRLDRKRSWRAGRRVRRIGVRQGASRLPSEAVLAPMPRAKVRVAMRARPRLFESVRTATQSSFMPNLQCKRRSSANLANALDLSGRNVLRLGRQCSGARMLGLQESDGRQSIAEKTTCTEPVYVMGIEQQVWLKKPKPGGSLLRETGDTGRFEIPDRA
jgi:hypothetical protein